MPEYYEFDCGCKVKIIDDKIKDYDGLPSMDIDYENLNLDCPVAWDLLSSGKTRGVFQLETPLGMSWAKKLEPDSIEELAALGAILRPGCLKSKLDNKSMTQHYVDRKHGLDQYKDIDHNISDIMIETHGIMVYQEQSMRIVQRLAGFDLKQADTLRKSTGKKDAALMAKVRVEFIEGCKKTGLIDNEKANLIFDMIQASARYQFNASHSFSYSIIGYWTAWLKSHFPLAFFSSWLSFSDKDDVGDFINDSKEFDVDIRNPSILLENENFKIVDGKVYCGIGNIKGVGETTAIKTLNIIKELQEEVGKELKDFSWIEVLILLTPRLTKTTVINLIAAGALSHLNIYRKRMMCEYNQLSSLTGKKEIPFLADNIQVIKSLDDGVQKLILSGTPTKSRMQKIESCYKTLTDKSFTTIDDENWVSSIEEELIGGSLSCSKLDVCDTTCGDTTCSQFLNKDTDKKINIACQVDRVSLYTPKNGKKMIYVTVKDATGSVEAVVFSDNVEKVESILYKGNTVCITGKKTQKGSLSIYDAIQI